MPEKSMLSSPSFITGMKFWSGSEEMAVTPAEPSILVPATVGSLASSAPHSNGGSKDFWLQDEREMKRQKRKEANRESARRSRMRKQEEYEDLASRAESLTDENNALKLEVSHLSELCQKLSEENSSLLDSIHNAQGGSKQYVQKKE